LELNVNAPIGTVGTSIGNGTLFFPKGKTNDMSESENQIGVAIIAFGLT
jgi:hypothetical protein